MEIIDLHEAAANRMVAEAATTVKPLIPEDLNDIIADSTKLESAMLFGAQQQQDLLQHQAAVNNMQQSAEMLTSLGMAQQGIQRDRPYWESFYGSLGQGMMPHVPNRGGGK